ncbi:MAG TPA: metallophosphoesterase family protein [Acidimicrobiales bacterium]|nr:metallophosphoesterase family protein [Acidimicrobiales bacterium]
MTTTVVVLADTHLRPGGAARLPDSVHRALDRADVVLHAGDIVTADLLHELSSWAPVHAVLGNNDHDPALAHLPVRRIEVLDGVRVAMVHDSGPRAGRAGRVRRWFPDAAVVIFGHSHVPANETGVDGQLLFNPGSPTQKRAQPDPTFGVLTLHDGRIVDSRIVVVGSDAPAPPR